MQVSFFGDYFMPYEIKKLIDGNKIFRAKYFDSHSTLYNELVVHGQKPSTMIVSCSDSRVDPALVFNCEPGDLFVIRNVANLVPPCEGTDSYHGTSAALEFGTRFLEVEHIVILGHTQCGGIQALLNSTEEFWDQKSQSFIAKWMEIARPVYHKIMQEHAQATPEEKSTLCEQYTLVNSLTNLQAFPWVQKRIKNGTLLVHAWYFELENGIIHAYDQETNSWSLL